VNASVGALFSVIERMASTFSPYPVPLFRNRSRMTWNVRTVSGRTFGDGVCQSPRPWALPRSIQPRELRQPIRWTSVGLARRSRSHTCSLLRRRPHQAAAPPQPPVPRTTSVAAETAFRASQGKGKSRRVGLRPPHPSGSLEGGTGCGTPSPPGGHPRPVARDGNPPFRGFARQQCGASRFHDS
jgi:hypothetical protein